MQQLKISTRLWMLLLLLSGLLLGVGGLGLYGTDQSNAGLRAVYEQRLVTTEQLSTIHTLMLRNQVALLTAMAVADPKEQVKATQEIANNVSRIDQELRGYLSAQHIPQEDELAKRFVEARRKFLLEGIKPAQEALKESDVDALNRIFLLKLRPLFVPVAKEIGALMALQHDLAEKEFLAATQRSGVLRTISIASIVAGLVLAALMGGRLIRGITRALHNAVQAADAVAHGDLTHPIVIKGQDEVSTVLRSLAAMQSNLSEIVSKVRTGSESVASASSEIAQGNNHLSNRTESQASALEETSASMEELNSAVHQNADNAKHANQLALSASKVAVQAGEVVSQVVTTMRGISDASIKINEIITVIDTIAFQTNILALNAAVEAARAGEQGRGFAVVAAEVRNLAKRSAEAAKEIKTLISTSVERVAHGQNLVDHAGSTMAQVVSGISRVSDVVGDISTASLEQSTGVSQVKEAISQMDQVTQQNAALVEQMAAAASSLKAQANDLVQTVSVFKITEVQPRNMNRQSAIRVGIPLLS